MIDFIRVYHIDKAKFESFVLEGKIFKNPIFRIDYKNKCFQYPITAYEPGVSVFIDTYRGYINGLLKVIFNEYGTHKISRSRNLKLCQISKSIKYFEKHIVGPKEIKISKIYFGLAVYTFKPGREIIRLNILMHKYNNYNHDLKPENNQIMKIFEYQDYAIAVYADNEEGAEKYYLKFQVQIKKSKVFKAQGISTLADLYDINVLNELYSILIDCFDDLTIIDDIPDFSVFSKDELKLKNFLRVHYWEEIAKNRTKQYRYQQRKRFEKLQVKYNLNTLKKSLKKEFERSFEKVIKEIM